MREDKEKARLEYVDDLTGLYNRRYFRERLLEEKRKADTKGSSFALMMIDVDNFKPINDLRGHLTGDQVLTQVGRLLEMSVRSSDTLCRYAGDEFVVTLPETEEDDVIQVAERIKDNFSEARWVNENGKPIRPVTCSLGYAFYSEKGRGLNELVGGADQALYAVKRRGGNGFAGEKDLQREPAGRPLSTTPHIVDREKELGRLTTLLEPDHGEERRLVLIHGEAGVGKTRLVRELCQVLERKGGIALLGDCHEETRSIPYYPFREAFNRFFDERKDAGVALLKGLPEYSQRELTRILPRLKDMKPSELERAPDPFRLFEAARLLLQALCSRSKNPLLFALENLQWADDASLDLLHYLVRNLRETRIQLFGTYRTEEKEREPSLIRFAGSLRREGLSEEMLIESLSTSEVSAMLRLLYPGTRVPADFEEFIFQKSEGNPFFVEELVKFVSEEEIGDGLPSVREVPLSVRAILERRTDTLAPEMKEILACAALVGEAFEFEVLRKVQGRSRVETLDAVEAAVKAHIIRECFECGDERYMFTHSLMADVLYSGTGKMRRRLWHAQVGEALEDLYAERLGQLNGRLTYHFERGENWEKALKYAIRSGAQAKEDYANQEAIRLYEKAKLILPKLKRDSYEETITIAQGLGDTYGITGDYEKALQEYRFLDESARDKGDEKKEADALSKISSVHEIQGNYDEMMRYAERSYEIREKIGDRGRVAESLSKIGTVYLRRGHYEEALKCYGESLKIGREIDQKTSVANSLESIASVHWHCGDYVDALKCVGESLKIRREIEDKNGEACSLNMIGNIHWSRGDYREALKCHEKSLKIRREIGFKRGVAGSLTNIGNVHWARGEYGQAFKYHEESLKIDREMGYKTGVLAGLINIGNIHWVRGDFDSALKSHEGALKISKDIGDKMNVAMSLNNIGSVQTETGDYGKALRCHKESLAIRKEIGERTGIAESLIELGGVHQSLYDMEKAMEYHKDALSLTEKLGAKPEKMWALAKLGIDHYLLGDFERALGYLEAASGILAESEEGQPEPDVLAALGNVWLAKGDFTKAHESCDRLMRAAEKEGLKKYLAVAKKLKGETILNEAVNLSEAERELKEARKIAKKIGALPVLWKIHASLGSIYEKKGDKKKASAEFSKARKVVDEIASKIGHEDLKNTFLNSKQVQSINQ